MVIFTTVFVKLLQEHPHIEMPGFSGGNVSLHYHLLCIATSRPWVCSYNNRSLHFRWTWMICARGTLQEIHSLLPTPNAGLHVSPLLGIVAKRSTWIHRAQCSSRFSVSSLDSVIPHTIIVLSKRIRRAGALLSLKFSPEDTCSCSTKHCAVAFG